MESSHMMASSYCTCTKEGPKRTPEALEEKVVVERAGEGHQPSCVALRTLEVGTEKANHWKSVKLGVSWARRR